MKSRLVLTMVALTMAIALVAGGTMAWFTDQADGGSATFTAGTVEIEAGGVFLGNTVTWANWNPGDCGLVGWTFTNTGTKSINLRVSIPKEWSWQGLKFEKVDQKPEFSQVFQASSRLGKTGPADWEHGLQTNHATTTTGKSDRHEWVSGELVPFTLSYDGGTVATFTVNNVIMTYPLAAGTSFKDMFINTTSLTSTETTKYTDLVLNGITLPDVTGNEKLWIGGNLNNFTLTGNVVMSWAEGARPTAGSALFGSIQLGTAAASMLPTTNVDWKLVDESSWTLVEEEDGWYYYYNTPIAGTFGGNAPVQVNLDFEVCLSGPLTTNEYQGANYTFSLTAEAVQSTHDAPYEVWGTTFFRPQN